MDTKKKEPSRKEERAAAPKAAAHTAPQDAKRRPIHQIRIEDVSASVWKRERQVRGQMLTFYSVTVERSYRDHTGQYRYTSSFDADSLGRLVTAAQQAHEYIHGLQYPEPEARR